MGEWLDWMMLWVFSNLSDSMILWFYTGLCGAIRGCVGPYGAMWGHTGPCGAIQGHTGPYGAMRGRVGLLVQAVGPYMVL